MKSYLVEAEIYLSNDIKRFAFVVRTADSIDAERTVRELVQHRGTIRSVEAKRIDKLREFYEIPVG